MSGNARRIMAPIFEFLTRRAAMARSTKSVTRVRTSAPMAEPIFWPKVIPLSLAVSAWGRIAVEILVPVAQNENFSIPENTGAPLLPCFWSFSGVRLYIGAVLSVIAAHLNRLSVGR